MTGDPILPLPRSIACPTCNKEIILTTYSQAVVMVCMHCAASFRLNASDEFEKARRFKELPAPPLIPLHTKARLHGSAYEVVGYLVKKEKGKHYSWREYILFNPEDGYATLSEFNGHWNFIYQLNAYFREQVTNVETITYKETVFNLYNKYQATVLHAAGEFYYNIIDDDDTKVREFIAPPFMLVYENSGDEIRWFKGEYISPADVKKEFNLDEVPPRSGVGATQLMAGGISLNNTLKLTGAFALLLLLIQACFQYSARESIVLNGTYYKTMMNNEKAIVTPVFTIGDGPSALDFDVSCPLNNAWLDVDLELVNNNTGERFEAIKSLEFYSGVDDEGSWSEGSRTATATVSSVPAGTYHVNIYPEWGGGSTDWNDQYFSLSVTEDVPLVSNLFWILLVISIFPAFLYLREKNFESKRWSESD